MTSCNLLQDGIDIKQNVIIPPVNEIWHSIKIVLTMWHNVTDTLDKLCYKAAKAFHTLFSFLYCFTNLFICIIIYIFIHAIFIYYPLTTPLKILDGLFLPLSSKTLKFYISKCFIRLWKKCNWFDTFLCVIFWGILINSFTSVDLLLFLIKW